MDKEVKFEELYKSNIINIDTLSKLAFGGIPQIYRAISWRLLLKTHGYNISNIGSDIKLKNQKYLSSVLEHDNSDGTGHQDPNYNSTKDAPSSKYCFSTYKNELSETAITIATRTKDVQERNKTIITSKHFHQIKIDVMRLPKSHLYFHDIDLSFMYLNILAMFAIRRPAVGYVQGMTDILSPLLQVFCAENIVTAESSSFYAFTKVIDNLHTNFIESQPGIYKSLREFDLYLMEYDRDLYENIESVSINSHMYAFRWFNCLFVREFHINEIFSVFDTFFSYNDLNRFCVFFAVSLLILNREVVMNKSFEQILMNLQDLTYPKYSTQDMTMLFNLSIFLENDSLKK